MSQTPPMSPKHCVSRTHLFNVFLCRGMEWDAAAGYTGDAMGWKPGLSQGCCWVLSQNVAGRSPWVSGIPGMSPGDVPGESRRSPGLSGDGAQGCLRPYLLPTSPPCRAPVVAGSSSIGFRLLLCFQLFLQLPRDEAEQRGQLAVGPQVLELEAAAAERAGGAGPPQAVAEDAAPAEAVAAVREPHGLREELQAAGAMQLQDALQPLQLDDSSHGRPGPERSARRVSLSPTPPPGPERPGPRRFCPALFSVPCSQDLGCRCKWTVI